MQYPLEDLVEAKRLEEQVHQINYSLIDELNHFHFEKNEYVLDAGCGTGVLSRHLVNHFGIRNIDSFDFSDMRIEQGRRLLNQHEKAAIHFYRQDLNQIDPQFHQKYDTVICRYVVEYASDPLHLITELKKTLKPGGRLIIIELDGVFVNLYSANHRLNEYLKELKQTLPFDLEIGRKIPSLMKEAGFMSLEWDATLLSCKGKALEEEYQNNVIRFSAVGNRIASLLGSLERGEEFRKLYLEEMKKDTSTSVFTKYICIGFNR